MKAEELRRSVLQLAVEGKLVEQRPEEGTARELLAEIAAERERLVREGRMKKGKPLAPVSPDEVPFEIPENWEWVRLGLLIELISGRDLTPTEYTERQAGIPYLTGASDIESGEIVVRRWTEFPKVISLKNDLLLTCKGSIGKTAIQQFDRAHIARQFMVLRPFHCLIVAYLKIFIESYIPYLENVAKSIIPGISREDILEIFFPLPPLAEQRRIVARLEELMPLIDAYDAEERRLSALETEFPEQLRRSLLQYAVEGKLVEQRPGEGTAKELLAEIASERERLIRAGKMKKGKPLAPVSPDEVPFEIPESWEWVRLGDLLISTDAGKSPNCETQPTVGNSWGVIKTTAIQKNRFEESENKILPNDFLINESYIIHQGDVLITRAGPRNRTGVTCCVDVLTKNLILSDKTIRLKPFPKTISSHFLSMVMNSDAVQNDLSKKFVGMAPSQVNISQENIRNVFFPLPPLAEQRRIVARLEELMPLVDTLETMNHP